MHNHDESKNDEAISLQLDLVDEVRATAEQKLSQYQDRMAKHYNSQRLPGWKSYSKESHECYKKPYPKEAQPQLGRTLPNHDMTEEGHLSPGDVRQTKAAISMEHRALTEVLPIEMTTWRMTPPFIYS